jgi:hypothetical protein
VGVEEAAVADLPILDEVDAQDCAAGHDERPPVPRGDDEVFELALQRSASDAARSSLVGSGARFMRWSQ